MKLFTVSIANGIYHFVHWQSCMQRQHRLSDIHTHTRTYTEKINVFTFCTAHWREKKGRKNEKNNER